MHRLLEKFQLVPKLPVPFGSKYLYEKPEKQYKPQYFKFEKTPAELEMRTIQSKMIGQMNLLERRRRLNQEATASLGADSADAAIQDLEAAQTTDIESEEVDIFERKRKFDQLVARIERHRRQKAHLRGNDLRHNIYLRKLEKLTRHDLGLDVEAYRDYVNNLKAFANINQDFELYARDSLKVDDKEFRSILTGGPDNETAEERQLRLTRLIKVKEINNVIYKLRREAASYLTDQDRAVIKDYIENMAVYMELDLENQQLIRTMYKDRKEEIQNRDKNLPVDLNTVTQGDLKAANVSANDFKQIKLLYRLDEHIFEANDFGTITSNSYIVDLTKYEPAKLTKEIKDLLYRPQKVKLLTEKYWQLAKEVRGRERENTDAKYYKNNHPRYPKKSTEEIQLLDKIFARLQVIQDEAYREMIAKVSSPEYQKQIEAYENRFGKIENIDELRYRIQGDMYGHNAFDDAIKRYKKLSEQEKKALKRGEDLDDIPTTDVEEFYYTMFDNSQKTNYFEAYQKANRREKREWRKAMDERRNKKIAIKKELVQMFDEMFKIKEEKPEEEEQQKLKVGQDVEEETFEDIYKKKSNSKDSGNKAKDSSNFKFNRESETEVSDDGDD